MTRTIVCGERWQIPKSRSYLLRIVASTELDSSTDRQQRANRDDRTLGFRSSQSAWGRPWQKTRLDVSSLSTIVQGLSCTSQLESFRFRISTIYKHRRHSLYRFSRRCRSFARFVPRVFLREISSLYALLLTTGYHTWTDVRSPF